MEYDILLNQANGCLESKNFTMLVATVSGLHKTMWWHFSSVALFSGI
jgi:hypothetical protein